jgi:hypothetical protein
VRRSGKIDAEDADDAVVVVVVGDAIAGSCLPAPARARVSGLPHAYAHLGRRRSKRSTFGKAADAVRILAECAYKLQTLQERPEIRGRVR